MTIILTKHWQISSCAARLDLRKVLGVARFSDLVEQLDLDPGRLPEADVDAVFAYLLEDAGTETDAESVSAIPQNSFH